MSSYIVISLFFWKKFFVQRMYIFFSVRGTLTVKKINMLWSEVPIFGSTVFSVDSTFWLYYTVKICSATADASIDNRFYR